MGVTITPHSGPSGHTRNPISDPLATPQYEEMPVRGKRIYAGYEDKTALGMGFCSLSPSGSLGGLWVGAGQGRRGERAVSSSSTLAPFNDPAGAVNLRRICCRSAAR